MRAMMKNLGEETTEGLGKFECGLHIIKMIRKTWLLIRMKLYFIFYKKNGL